MFSVMKGVWLKSGIETRGVVKMWKLSIHKKCSRQSRSERSANSQNFRRISRLICFGHQRAVTYVAISGHCTAVIPVAGCKGSYHKVFLDRNRVVMDRIFIFGETLGGGFDFQLGEGNKN